MYGKTVISLLFHQVFQWRRSRKTCQQHTPRLGKLLLQQRLPPGVASSQTARVGYGRCEWRSYQRLDSAIRWCQGIWFRTWRFTSRYRRLRAYEIRLLRWSSKLNQQCNHSSVFHIFVKTFVLLLHKLLGSQVYSFALVFFCLVFFSIKNRGRETKECLKSTPS